MTLEGEYYWQRLTCATFRGRVAILMTLEGEYYMQEKTLTVTEFGRNPHDIGRRILLFPIS